MEVRFRLIIGLVVEWKSFRGETFKGELPRIPGFQKRYEILCSIGVRFFEVVMF